MINPTTTIRTVISAAVLAVGLAGAATAQTAEFTFSASEAPDAIYSRFQKTAHEACRDDIRREGPMAIGMAKARIELCEQDLLERAIAKVSMPTLAALNDAESEARNARILAARQGSSGDALQ